jgi:hypothetical protein
LDHRILVTLEDWSGGYGTCFSFILCEEVMLCRDLRRVIWMMTTGVIQYSDAFKVYYLKRRKEGLPYKKAVLATAHKLIRVIYAMLTQRTTFCPQGNS